MTDETTHLRALLAEQTARAERAEAEIAAAYGALTMIDTGGTGTLADRVNDLRALWVRAEAANAELRAALERMIKYAVEDRATTPGSTRLERQITRANCLLSRPDLGAGKVLVARDVVERVRRMFDLLRETTTDRTRAEQMAEEARALNLAGIIADLDAALKKGGG